MKKKNIAVVTGASSGIGQAVSRKLCEAGYEVYGFGREFEKKEGIRLAAWEASEEIKERFHTVVCDLLEEDTVLQKLEQIMKMGDVRVLVNNAGVGYYGIHEELNPKKIREMVRTNLEIPMLLSWRLLRTLKAEKGALVFISSVTAEKSNPHGCAYGATKAGLTSFAHSLFDEARKYGLRVIQIKPDMTQTNLYRNANFREDEDIMAYLEPGEVAEAVLWALEKREGLVVSDITLKPQLHRIRKE